MHRASGVQDLGWILDPKGRQSEHPRDGDNVEEFD